MTSVEPTPPSAPGGQKIVLSPIDIGRMRELRAAEEATRMAGAMAPAMAAPTPAAEAKQEPTPRSGFAAKLCGWGARVADTLIYTPLAKLMTRTNRRFVLSSFPGRIGHLAAELDLLFKEMELGLRPKFKPIYLMSEGVVANEALVEVWKAKVTFISSPFWTRLLAPIVRRPEMVYYLSEPLIAIDVASPYPSVLAKWGDRPPVVELPQRMQDDAKAALKRWGMKDDGWFVCVHNREPGYSPVDEDIHRFRNASIDNYRLAIDEIVARGGFVVRLGDTTMKKLPEIEGVYDYAHALDRAPHLDIALAGMCRFFLGTTSGMASVATLFGRPCAMTNAVPSGMAPGVAPNDVSIPKILRDEKGRRYRYKQIFEHGVSRWRAASQFRDARIRVEQNSPDEIRDLVLEMIERDEGVFQPSEDDIILQETFKRFLTPRDYTFGTEANVGRAFLRKYAMFL